MLTTIFLKMMLFYIKKKDDVVTSIIFVVEVALASIVLP